MLVLTRLSFVVQDSGRAPIVSDVNETLQELLNRRLREMGGNHEPRTLRSAHQALPAGGDWVTYEVVRRVSKGHARITDRAARTLATMLAVGEDEIRQAAGQRSKLGPFELPPRAERLNESERGVVLSVVDAILSAAEGDARASTQSDAPGSPNGANDGHNVTHLPTAEALDPTLPEDVAARTEEAKGRTQAERDRQDDEGEY